MNYEVSLVLGIISAIVLTVFLYIKVMPGKKDGTFNKGILQFLHNYFNFKKLYLEEVLKCVFSLATIACVTTGALLLISTEEVYHYSYYSGSYYTKESTFLYGLLVMVAGPIALRLVYEVMMMFILLVKNVMDINNKLKVNNGTPVEEAPAPAPVEYKNPFDTTGTGPNNPPSF